MFHSKLNLATTGAPPGAVLCAAQLSSVRPKKSETTKLWPSPPPLGRTMSTLTRSTLSRSKTAGSAHGREGERLLRGADAARDVGQRAAGRGQRERARRGGGRLGGPALLARARRAARRGHRAGHQKKKLALAVLAAHRAGRRGSITEAQRAKAAKVCEKELSIAARAVAKLPLVRGRVTSRVVTFHFNRVTQIERTYGVAPTLTKSGAYLLRDAFGVRSMTGGEVAKLHGYPQRVIAAYEAVASSGQIVAAVGDGFVINVVRDVIKAAVRAVAGNA
jgi:hypothetical protein